MTLNYEASKNQQFFRLLNRIENYKPKKLAHIVGFILYIVLLVVISVFHEPWFDEAESWQIARCASLYDILFTLPHFEGHPPLWHLILVPFAKSGMPYEFSLSFVNITFSSIAMWILMFKTKLPDLMRLLLPFTYFYFYQYGVVSRTYSVMSLAFMLCAICYKEKHKKPLRMVLSLALLCGSSAYGIAIAGCICLIWLFEELQGKKFTDFVREFVKSRTFYCLLGLLVFAIALFIDIYPDPTAYAVNDGYTYKDTLSSLMYSFFILQSDSTVGSYMLSDTIGMAEFDLKMLASIPISLMVMFVLYMFAKKHNCRRMLAIQFVVLPLMFALVRFSAHHIGIVTMFMVFWMCVAFDSDKEPVNLGKFDVLYHYIFVIAGCLFFAIEIGWTVTSSIEDINHNYNAGRDLAQYIIDNDLQDEDFMVECNSNYRDDDIVTADDYEITLDDIYFSFSMSGMGTPILAYLSRNIFDNFNSGQDDMAYSYHSQIIDEDEYNQEVERIQALDDPTYYIGRSNQDPNLYLIYNIYSFNPSEYKLVYETENSMIYKGNYSTTYYGIYKKVES